MRKVIADAKTSVTPFHKGIKEIPSQEYLRECFDYRDGELIWKRRPVSHFVDAHAATRWNNKMGGKKAGHLSSDRKYMKVTLGKTDFYSHRIIWTWHYGAIPGGIEIDHKDGNSMDSSIGNLRHATMRQSATNRGLFKNKKSGLPKGVTKDRRLFRCRVVVNKKIRFTGWYKTEQEASEAYQKAAKELHGEFARNPAPLDLSDAGIDLLPTSV